MADPRPHIPRPATALLALARALAMDDSVPEAELAILTEAVTRSRSERAALLSALQDANTPELRAITGNLIAAHAADLRAREAALTDLDDIAGLWGLRLMTGALLFVGGGLLVGTVPNGAGLLALAATALGTFGVGLGRLRLRRARNEAARAREIAETLAAEVSRR